MSKVHTLTIISVFGLFLFMVAGCNTSQAQLEKNISTGMVVHINDSIFKQKVFDYTAKTNWEYSGETPCIIDFYADWCAPCRRMAPLLEEMAKKYEGKIIVYKVDTDKEKVLTQNMGITNLPTLVFIPKSGKPRASSGAIPMEDLEKAINSILTIQKN